MHCRTYRLQLFGHVVLVVKRPVCIFFARIGNSWPTCDEPHSESSFESILGRNVLECGWKVINIPLTVGNSSKFNRHLKFYNLLSFQGLNRLDRCLEPGTTHRSFQQVRIVIVVPIKWIGVSPLKRKLIEQDHAVEKVIEFDFTTISLWLFLISLFLLTTISCDPQSLRKWIHLG